MADHWASGAEEIRAVLEQMQVIDRDHAFGRLREIHPHTRVPTDLEPETAGEAADRLARLAEEGWEFLTVPSVSEGNIVAGSLEREPNSHLNVYRTPAGFITFGTGPRGTWIGKFGRPPDESWLVSVEGKADLRPKRWELMGGAVAGEVSLMLFFGAGDGQIENLGEVFEPGKTLDLLLIAADGASVRLKGARFGRPSRIEEAIGAFYQHRDPDDLLYQIDGTVRETEGI